MPKIQFIFTRHQGFDAGLWAYEWSRWGPFVFVRYLEGESIRCPACGEAKNLSDWSLLVIFTRKAFMEFWEGASK